MGALMENVDIDFVRSIVDEVNNGQQFSRDLIFSCYVQDLKTRQLSESMVVSEKWVDYYWERLSNAPFDRIRKVASSTPKLAKVLLEVLGR